MSLSIPLIHLSRLKKHLTFITSTFWRLFFKNININTLVLFHTLSFPPICKHLYPRVYHSFSVSLCPSLSVLSHFLVLSVSYSLTPFLTLYSSLCLFLYNSLGLFRVSGDHNLLSLVKTRLEPSWTSDKKLYLECVIIGTYFLKIIISSILLEFSMKDYISFIFVIDLMSLLQFRNRITEI